HLGRIDRRRVEQHYEVVGGLYELDTELPPGVDHGQLLELMARDKKALGSELTFVLDGPTGVEVVADVPADAAADALDAMMLG
ncbi:MAG TPA: 3-dehydroquinate synthase, partial [Ilumatobacteraceae bacterium]|nr:3-dehydroquinate synthase [Ilumatobacteraceae bacterium]